MKQKKLIVALIVVVFPNLLNAQMKDYETGDGPFETVLNRGEEAPFYGVLVPEDAYRLKEKQALQLEYLEPRYMKCLQEPKASSNGWAVAAALVGGVLLGFSAAQLQR